MARKKRVPLKLVGVAELNALFDRLGKLPLGSAPKAARRGARVLADAIKAKAPVDTGMLRRGIYTMPEKRSRKGKRVFQVTYRSDMNDWFVKHYGPKLEKRAYYPASMEYGYRTRGGGYIPGYYFMRKTAEQKKAEIEQVIISVVAAEMDKMLSKR